MNDKDWYIPTKNDVHAQNERNRRNNETYEKLVRSRQDGLTNNWREIRKARRPVSPWRCWATGFAWGAITLAVMSYLTWLAWKAF